MWDADYGGGAAAYAGVRDAYSRVRDATVACGMLTPCGSVFGLSTCLETRGLGSPLF